MDGRTKDTIVVQVGDTIDSCRPSNTNNCLDKIETETYGDLSVIEVIYLINKIAKPHGGQIISLLGNHEIMNYRT